MPGQNQIQVHKSHYQMEQYLLNTTFSRKRSTNISSTNLHATPGFKSYHHFEYCVCVWYSLSMMVFSCSSVSLNLQAVQEKLTADDATSQLSCDNNTIM